MTKVDMRDLHKPIYNLVITASLTTHSCRVGLKFFKILYLCGYYSPQRHRDTENAQKLLWIKFRL